MSADTNFIDITIWQGDDIYERFAALRDEDPIYWSKETELWMITGYKEAEFVSKNQQLFTSEEGVRPKEDTIIGLIDEAEPRHGAMRNMINRGFSPRMVGKLEPVFREIATEALDQIASKGECDFVESYAVPLPIRLIAKMLGIRDEDRDLFHQWSDDLIASDGNHDDPEIMARSGQAFMEYSKYVTEIIEDRRKSPKDDLISILVGAKDAGLLDKEFPDQRNIRPHQENSEEYLAMANDELIILLVVLMVAGNETTRNGISGGMQLLIENPEARAKLIDDPSLIPCCGRRDGSTGLARSHLPPDPHTGLRVGRGTR